MRFKQLKLFGFEQHIKTISFANQKIIKPVIFRSEWYKLKKDKKKKNSEWHESGFGSSNNTHHISYFPWIGAEWDSFERGSGLCLILVLAKDIFV